MFNAVVVTRFEFHFDRRIFSVLGNTLCYFLFGDSIV